MINDWYFGKENLKYGIINSLKEWSDDMELIAIICDFFNFFWKRYNDGKIVLEDKVWSGEKIGNTNVYYGHCKWIGYDYTGHFEETSVRGMCKKLKEMICNIDCNWNILFNNIKACLYVS